MEALEQHSPTASVFVLVHKMDLIQEDQRENVFNVSDTPDSTSHGDHASFTYFHCHIQDRKALILERCRMKDVNVFQSSIWDETLYRAWSRVSEILDEQDHDRASLPDVNRLCIPSCPTRVYWKITWESFADSVVLTNVCSSRGFQAILTP